MEQVQPSAAPVRLCARADALPNRQRLQTRLHLGLRHNSLLRPDWRPDLDVRAFHDGGLRPG